MLRTGAVGSGQAMKALNNLVSAGGFLIGIEALLIGSRFGLDPAVMVDVLNAATGMNNSTQKKFKQFVLSRSFASGFTLDLLVKDLSIALQVGRETATATPFAALCREMASAAASHAGAGRGSHGAGQAVGAAGGQRAARTGVTSRASGAARRVVGGRRPLRDVRLDAVRVVGRRRLVGRLAAEHHLQHVLQLAEHASTPKPARNDRAEADRATQLPPATDPPAPAAVEAASGAEGDMNRPMQAPTMMPSTSCTWLMRFSRGARRLSRSLIWMLSTTAESSRPGSRTSSAARSCRAR